MSSFAASPRIRGEPSRTGPFGAVLISWTLPTGYYLFNARAASFA
jgi:hypothetical protein